MTTEITIKNSKDSQHLINIIDPDRPPRFAGARALIPPGGEYSLYLWEGRDITVSEGESVIVSYKNPKNLKGPVFIEEDGTIRELGTVISEITRNCDRQTRYTQ